MIELVVMNTIEIIKELRFFAFSPDGHSSYPNQSHLDDISIVKDVHWYHATSNPNWLEDVVYNNVPVHLGSEETALDRMRFLSSSVGSFESPSEWFLFKLKLSRSATVAKHYVKDMVDDWANTVYDDSYFDDYSWESLLDREPFMFSREFRKLTNSNDFVRYVNLHEYQGHISLIGNPSQLEIVDVFDYGMEP